MRNSLNNFAFSTTRLNVEFSCSHYILFQTDIFKLERLNYNVNSEISRGVMDSDPVYKNKVEDILHIPSAETKTTKKYCKRRRQLDGCVSRERERQFFKSHKLFQSSSNDEIIS